MDVKVREGSFVRSALERGLGGPSNVGEDPILEGGPGKDGETGG